MKKKFLYIFIGILAIILTSVLILSLFGGNNVSSTPNDTPSSETNDNQEKNNENNESNQQKKKISGAIETGTVFSEGLALVQLVENKKTIYCIDKQGYIVFETTVEKTASLTAFCNGYATINGKIYDHTGKSIAPEDVGATNFYLDNDIVKYGYILATKITSDFNGSKKELGIFDKNFNWVVSPSEELYQGLFNGAGTLYSVAFSNNYLYLPLYESYLNILTGEILETEPEDFVSTQSDIATKYFSYVSDGTYIDKNNNIVIDLREYDTLEYGWSFVNGKAVILFKNTISTYNYKYYYTIIDKDGVFAFDPVEIDIDYVATIKFDGEYVIFQDQMITSYTTNYACYDSAGKFKGKTTFSRQISIQEGVINAYEINLYGSDRTYYYNPDFTPLF